MGFVSSNGCELPEDAPLPLPLPDDVDVSSIIPRGTRIFVASTCGSGSVDDDDDDGCVSPGGGATPSNARCCC